MLETTVSREKTAELVWAKLTIHTHTHLTAFLSGTTQLSRYQMGRTNLEFTEARDSEWQWHQLGHMQVCTLIQTENHSDHSRVEIPKLDHLSLPLAKSAGATPPAQQITGQLICIIGVKSWALLANGRLRWLSFGSQLH